MGARYKTYMKYGDENTENCYDGIIDTKNDDQYICNWHSIMRMLNQYDDRIDYLQKENNGLKQTYLTQQQMIHTLNMKVEKLEELLMLRKLEKKINEEYKYEEL